MKLLLLLLLALPLQAANLDPLANGLADNRVRAGVRAEELYRPITGANPSGLSAEELDDYRFLLANLPLSDLALMSSTDLIDNVHLARSARERFTWGAHYDEAMFRQFVLPHRVSQEPFVHYRKQFLDEIGPRVKDLSMGDAILEVNHWCHEKATYRPTDGRDQDPLTTIRSGFGRCEEEMILTISALRSVGIPARQCYTPYWAHSDDNHAWVEAWADGKWYYLGACEPAQELNQAWFSGPAQRAMLVVSTAYGDYEGDEPVLRRYGRSTNINSTAVYGPTKELKVTVLDRKGKPAKDVRVIFSLWNYGSLMPAAGVTTDEHGVATLTCGIGDWFVGATNSPPAIAGGDKGGVFSRLFRKKPPEPLMVFAHIKGDQTEATLKLDSATPQNWLTACEYTPPPVPETKVKDIISAEGIARGLTSADTKELADSLFRARLTWEDSVREAGVYVIHDAALAKPEEDFAVFSLDSNAVWELSTFDTLSEKMKCDIYDLLLKSRGNWFNLYKYLLGLKRLVRLPAATVPGFKEAQPFSMPKAGQSWPPNGFDDKPIILNVDFAGGSMNHIRKMVFYVRMNRDRQTQIDFFKSLSEKDLRDTSPSMTMNASIMIENRGKTREDSIEPADSLQCELYEKYILPTRVDNEPPIELPKYEIGYGDPRFLLARVDHLRLSDESSDSKGLLKFMRDSITVETSIDRLGPPLTPIQCLSMRRGTESDIERLYIGVCRQRGIPARRNPMTNVVERWEDPNGWVTVNVLAKEEQGKRDAEKGSGKLAIEITEGDSAAGEALFMKDWALAKWEGPLADVQDLGWHQPYKAMSWPVELPAGWYLLSSGKRRDDGSAPAKFVWIEVKAGAEAKAKLEFR